MSVCVRVCVEDCVRGIAYHAWLWAKFGQLKMDGSNHF